MKDEMQNNPTVVSSSLAVGGSGGTKYGGLLKRSAIKVFHEKFVRFIFYVSANTPKLFLLHKTLAFFRVLQLIGPSLAAPIISFWGKSGTFGHSLISIVSIFFMLIPPDLRIPSTALYFFCAYLAYDVLNLLVLFGGITQYKKTANLPKKFVIFYSTFYGIFNYFFHPIACEMCGEMLSLYVCTDNRELIVPNLILGFISIILAVFIFLYLDRETIQTIVFRPTAFLSVSILPQILIYTEILVLNFLTGISVHCTANWTIALYFIVCAVIYGASTWISFLQGGFIKPFLANSILSSNITGAIMCLIVAVFLLLKQEATIVIFFVFICIWVVFYVVSLLLFKRLKMSYLITLDLFLDNKDNEDYDFPIKTVNKFLAVATYGFAAAHPAIFNWQLFKQAVEIWKSKKIVWYFFAKFVAIYPEESTNLTWIYRMLKPLKLRGSLVRTIKNESTMIMRQREANLSSELKLKLNHLTKELTSSKRRLRHVWDSVIQGNYMEIESATRRAFEDIDKCEAEFLHLFGQFPNNRFVSRQYARFTKEILADHVLFNETIEKTRLLQRGLIANVDQTHELGICAFPSVPECISAKSEKNFIEHSTSTSIDNVLDEVDDFTADMDQYALLKQRIEELKIPSTLGTTVIRIMILIVFFYATSIGFYIYLENYISVIQKPLDFMYSISMIRTYAYTLGMISFHYVYELLDPCMESGAWNPMQIIPNVTLTSIGSSWQTHQQLPFLMNSAQAMVQRMINLRSYSEDNQYITAAKNLIFGNTFKYVYWPNDNNESNARTEYISMQTAMNDIIAQITELSQIPPIDPSVKLNKCVDFIPPVPPSIVNSSVVRNLIINTDTFDSHLGNALNLLIQYIYHVNLDCQTYGNYILIFATIVVVIVFVVSTVLELIWIRSNKIEVYKCLSFLPKSVVSNVAENLRLFNKEGTATTNTTNGEDIFSSNMNNSEISKQDDNIMKILVAEGGSSTTGLEEAVVFSVMTLIIIALDFGEIYTLTSLYKFEARILQENAPHMNYLSGTFALHVAGMYSTEVVISDITDTAKMNINMTEYIPKVEQRILVGVDYWNLARYGGQTKSETPFSHIEKAIQDAIATLDCSDKKEVRRNFFALINCFSVDMSIVMFFPLMITKVISYGVTFDPSTFTAGFNQLYTLLFYPIYEFFIYPMFEQIIPLIKGDMEAKSDEVFPTFIVLLIICIIPEIVIFMYTRSIESHIRRVLTILMHCPPEAVFSTPRIMKILSNDFSAQKVDPASRDSAFFVSVVYNFPDAVIICNMVDMKITSANKVCKQFFGIESSDLVGNNLRSFLEGNFNGDFSKMLENDSKNLSLECTFKTADGNEKNLEVSSMHLNGNKQFSVIMRDITQTVRYNTLIREEIAKSDQLLSSILPANLVTRVQNGEKDISFAVQTATIVFMDIVEFTPWCGKLEAHQVMSTLNTLFKYFDACCAKYSTMTKIKCIGDCYMGAGGVFSEINQPAEHAKDVVNFGIDAIDAVQKLNGEIGETLRIRVGVNTGGPIVAGVLGIGKPTFEIFGPAINLAQQMEHHGVPMKVHVTRSVYELIYGDFFVVKERGVVEIKGGSVITYFVERKA